MVIFAEKDGWKSGKGTRWQGDKVERWKVGKGKTRIGGKGNEARKVNEKYGKK